MEHEKCERAGRRALVGAVCMIVGLTFSAAAQPEPASIDRAKENILGIQNHLTNATMKIRHGISGSSKAVEAIEAAGRTPTPAESCCYRNIETINKNIRQLTIATEQWDLNYADQQNTEALATLNELRGQLGEVAEGIGKFRSAPTREQALAAMQGIIRPFNALRQASETLEACCPLPTDAGRQKKSNKK